MKKRKLIEFLLFAIITCGIYTIYWSVTTYGELAVERGEKDQIILNVILYFVTCGLWGIYLVYKIYTYVNDIEKKHNPNTEDISTGIIILALFAGIIPYMLIQDRINYIIDNYMRNDYLPDYKEPEVLGLENKDNTDAMGTMNFGNEAKSEFNVSSMNNTNDTEIKEAVEVEETVNDLGGFGNTVEETVNDLGDFGNTVEEKVNSIESLEGVTAVEENDLTGEFTKEGNKEKPQSIEFDKL